MVVYARDLADNQVKGFLVDTRTEGYSATKIENKISLRTVQNADITLENVVVPEFFKLANANSFRDTNKVLKVTRLSVAWQAVGQHSPPSTLPGATRWSATSSAAHRLLPAGAGPARADPRQRRHSMGMMVRLSRLEDGPPRRQSALAKAFTTAACARG